MTPAPSACIPDGLLAAMPQLREKLHLGVPSSNPALYLGFSVCKSTTALGLQAALHLERVQSRSTGKERDTESGNDYFDARYYSSAMGRFMSPDWSAKIAPVPYAKLDNPQTLNLYAYVGNNPLTRVDVTGHYECNGSKEQCGAIKNALNLIKTADASFKAGSSERGRLDKVLSFYGSEGQKNGVSIGFANLGGSTNAETDSKSFLGTGLFKTTSITFDLGSMKSNFGNQYATESAGTVAHEGTHGVDGMEVGPPQTKRDFLATEFKAYQSQALVAQGLGVNSAYGVWDTGWDPKKASAYSLEAVGVNAKANADADCAGGACK